MGLLPASRAPAAGELVIDRLSLYDCALKANVAAWRNIHAALAASVISAETSKRRA